MRRRLLAALVLVPTLTLTAAACSSGGSASSSASPPAPVSTTGAVTANPAFGGPPDLAIPKTKPPTTLQTQVLTPGTGATVTKNSLVTVNYRGVSWSNRETFDSSFARNQTFQTTLDGVIPGWQQGLVGQKAGSRVLLTIPPALGYGAQGNPPTIKANETLVFIVDIVNSVDQASGQAVTPPADLPTVQTDASGGVTGVTIPAGKPEPTALTSQVLIQGTGADIKNTDNLYARFVTYLWDGGKLIGPGWDDEVPQAVSLAATSDGQGGTTNGAIQGVVDGLTGKKIGSRVLLVIPAAQAFGATGNSTAGIPANASLVMVIDVLDYNTSAAAAGS